MLIATVLTKCSVYNAKPGHAFAENGRPNYKGKVNNIYQVSTPLSQYIIVQFELIHVQDILTLTINMENEALTSVRNLIFTSDWKLGQCRWFHQSHEKIHSYWTWHPL